MYSSVGISEQNMVFYTNFSLIFGGDTLCVVQIMNIQAMGGACTFLWVLCVLVAVWG
jgi:hypothetical protein